jgi:hypothetical protein
MRPLRVTAFLMAVSALLAVMAACNPALPAEPPAAAQAVMLDQGSFVGSSAGYDKVVYVEAWTQQLGMKQSHEVYRIFTMNSDGTDQQRITSWTTHGYVVNQPRWLADGRIDYFGPIDIGQSGYRGGNSYPAAVWVMNADGTSPRKITDVNPFDGGPIYHPGGLSASPDGAYIAYGVQDWPGGSPDYPYVVCIVATDGATPPVVALVGEVRPDYDKDQLLPFNWSPDLDPVTPSYQGKILIGHLGLNDAPWGVKGLNVEIDTNGNLAVGTEDPTPYVDTWTYAEWSPDGARIACKTQVASLPDGTPQYVIRVVDLVAGTDPLLVTQGVYQSPARWSADSQWLVSTALAPKARKLAANYEVPKVPVPAVITAPLPPAPIFSFTADNSHPVRLSAGYYIPYAIRASSPPQSPTRP